MKTELIIAGFGGQGVLSLGMTLAYAGMLEGKEVTWMPSYGPEMRGGTAYCVVIISHKRISSPIISRFDTLIVLNQPSLDKFEKDVKTGGSIFYEENNIINSPTRDDISIHSIPAVEEAVQLKNVKIMNMILLGSYLELNPILDVDSIIKALKKVLPKQRHNLIPVNEQALIRGAEMVKGYSNQYKYSDITVDSLI